MRAINGMARRIALVRSGGVYAAMGRSGYVRHAGLCANIAYVRSGGNLPPQGEADSCVIWGYVQISRMFVAAAICRHGAKRIRGKLRFTPRRFVYAIPMAAWTPPLRRWCESVRYALCVFVYTTLMAADCRRYGDDVNLCVMPGYTAYPCALRRCVYASTFPCFPPCSRLFLISKAQRSC